MRAYELRPGRTRPGWRAWRWPAYNVVVVALVTGLGVSVLVGGEPPRSLGGVVLIGAGLWWARSVVASWRFLLTRRDRDAPVGLRLDDAGVTVLGVGCSASLEWDRCIAVVASRMSQPVGGGPQYYVHFMPRRDDDVRLGDVPVEHLAARAARTGVRPGPSAAMVWELSGADLLLVPDVLAQVRARARHVRVVDSTRRARSPLAREVA